MLIRPFQEEQHLSTPFLQGEKELSSLLRRPQ
jgi:hypothetical protein